MSGISLPVHMEHQENWRSRPSSCDANFHTREQSNSPSRQGSFSTVRRTYSPYRNSHYKEEDKNIRKFVLEKMTMPCVEPPALPPDKLEPNA